MSPDDFALLSVGGVKRCVLFERGVDGWCRAQDGARAGV